MPTMKYLLTPLTLPEFRPLGSCQHFSFRVASRGPLLSSTGNVPVAAEDTVPKVGHCLWNYYLFLVIAVLPGTGNVSVGC